VENFIKAMDKSITCLAVALPEDVYDDVRKTWQDLRAAITTQQVANPPHNPKDDDPWVDNADIDDGC